MPFFTTGKGPLSPVLLLAVCFMTGLQSPGLLWADTSHGPASPAADNAPDAGQTGAGESSLLSRAFDLYRRGDYGEAALAAEKFLSEASLPEAEEAAHFLLGDCYYQSLASNRALNSQLALNSYQKGLQKFPHSVLAPKVTYRMAEIYSGQKRYEKAAYLWRNNISRHPDSPWVPWSALLLGQNLLRQGKEAEGLKVLKGLCGENPDSPVALRGRVVLIEYFIENRKFSEALEQYKQIQAFDQIVDCAEDLGKIPGLLVKLSRPAEARDLLFKLLNLLPEDPRAPRWAVMIGDTFAMEEMHTEALKSYYETRDRFADTDGAALARAGILSLRAQEPSRVVFQQVVREFDALVAASADNRQLKTALLQRKALMLNRSGHVGDSIVVIRELLKLGPPRSLRKEVLGLYQEALNEEIRALAKAGKHDEIVILSQQSFSYLSLGSLDEETARIIADSHFDAGLFHAAAAQIEKLLQRNGPAAGDERLLCRLGRAYLELGQTDRSDKVLEALLHRFPKSVVQGDSLAVLGQAALERNDGPTAVDYFRLALKAGNLEEEGFVYYLLGSVYRQEGQRLAALEAFQSAVQAAGRDPQTGEGADWDQRARYGFGDMLYEAGREAEALRIYTETIARYPESQGVDWARYRIAQIHLRNREVPKAAGILAEMSGRETDRILMQLVRHSQGEIVWQRAFKELF